MFGPLSLAVSPVRSRHNQAQAGKPNRLEGDDGGHFIAARFNGPSDSFNHFAQDATFNRGAYRVMEDRWARELRAGHKVFVVIESLYHGASKRPYQINVYSEVDGKKFRKKFPTKRKAPKMAKDKFDILGPLYNEIGVELVDIVGGDPDGIFLYVEIGDRWISPNIFKNEGHQIRNFDDTEVLSDLLWEAWYAESDEGGIKRWSILEYEIKDGKFDVSFRYPDEVDVEVIDDERRQDALRARFGDKPVVYPPMPKTAFELKP